MLKKLISKTLGTLGWVMGNKNLRCEVQVGSTGGTGGMGVGVAGADDEDEGALEDMVALEKVMCRLTLASVDG